MLEEIKRQFSSVQILITLLIIAVGLYLFQILWQVLSNFSDIFVMLISSWLLSFILEPAVERCMIVTKLSKIASALIVYTAFLGLVGVIVFLFIPSLVIQMQNLLTLLPKIFAAYPAYFGKFGDSISQYIGGSIIFLPSVANFFISVIIVLIISFYFVIDKVRINEELFKLIPKKWDKDAEFIQSVINTVFASFLRVQLWFGILAGVSTWIVLRLFGIDFAASTAVLAGILTMVPLLGPVLGFLPPAIVAFATDPARGLFVSIFIIILQTIIFNVVGPKLLGKAFKMHPVIVLLSFIVGFKIAGGAGAIFAVPVLGICIIVIHRLGSHFLNPSSTK